MTQKATSLGVWVWTKRIFLFILILIATLVLVLSFYGKMTQSSFVAQYPAPGKLVKVGDHSLHLNCTGEGPATIVFESGGGSWSHDWHNLQAEVEKIAQVCSYDRAGFGWSEKAESPRDFNNMVADLNQLLINGEVEGPYIFVGASLGGALVQLYAQKYPENVAGMLLLDARGKAQMRMLDLHPGLLPPPSVMKVANVVSSMGLVSPILSMVGVEAILKPAHPNFGGYDQSIKDVYLDATGLANNIDAMLQEALIDDLSEQQTYAIETLGNIPLIVVSHGKENRFDGLEMGDAKRDEIEAFWQALQMEMVFLSTRGELVIAEDSGHLIQFDQPKLVIDSIKKLISMTIEK